MPWELAVLLGAFSHTGRALPVSCPELAIGASGKSHGQLGTWTVGLRPMATHLLTANEDNLTSCQFLYTSKDTPIKFEFTEPCPPSGSYSTDLESSNKDVPSTKLSNPLSHSYSLNFPIKE